MSTSLTLPRLHHLPHESQKGTWSAPETWGWIYRADSEGKPSIILLCKAVPVLWQPLRAPKHLLYTLPHTVVLRINPLTQGPLKAHRVKSSGKQASFSSWQPSKQDNLQIMTQKHVMRVCEREEREGQTSLILVFNAIGPFFGRLFWIRKRLRDSGCKMVNRGSSHWVKY